MKEKVSKIIAFMPTKSYTFCDVEDCIKEVCTFIGTRAAKVIDDNVCAITVNGTCQLDETDLAQIDKICEKNNCGAIFMHAKGTDDIESQYDAIAFATITSDKTLW